VLPGAQKGADKPGFEAEAFAIYDTMRYVKPSVGTVCVGSAYGEAAMLLAAGEKVRSPCAFKLNSSFHQVCSLHAVCASAAYGEAAMLLAAGETVVGGPAAVP